jgi:hypothetical protein
VECCALKDPLRALSLLPLLLLAIGALLLPLPPAVAEGLVAFFILDVVRCAAAVASRLRAAASL